MLILIGFERHNMVLVLISLFDKLSSYQKRKSFGCHFTTQFRFDVICQTNFVPPWKSLDD